MLVELVVENLAVVERLRVCFHDGLNTLTGETGSGKSLVVDALGLLFGGRASADLIRAGAERLFVSGRFELPQDPLLIALLDEAGIGVEDNELLIEREVNANGKSRAYAASRPVTVAFLRDLAPFLGDIHGQHDQQRLFSGDSQRGILDQTLPDSSLLTETSEAYSRWRSAAAALDELDRTEQDRLRLADFWTMQRNEIESLGLTPDEDTALEGERNVLKNVTRLSEQLTAAFESLSESESSAASRVASSLKRLEEAARLDAKLQPVAGLLRPAHIAITEAAHELRHYLGHLEADPSRLDTVETRLAQIERLKRKYGSSIEEILAFLDQVRARIDAVENASARRAQLQDEMRERESTYRAAASRLRETRLKAARKLGRQVETELASLAMKGTRFRISIADSAPSAAGLDSIEFLVAANVGEELRPLDKVASGGELSRIALALKTCMVAHSGPPNRRTLVFDEVDAGVGGAAAEAVGLRLKKISSSDQVLCVTHLAQIARFAGHHYLVSKRETKGRTVAGLAELNHDDRVREIARMVSGQTLTEEALQHARKLIQP
ncbi:MAG TPA: DNA repair protein RecN [Bryobacteraceae bacterium]|nr:DNA repair protein RecN [Bryobacteraceae bacterium]HPT27496.1 DNA repair protein RecN [Bryobacteraceae bacterium]